MLLWEIPPNFKSKIVGYWYAFRSNIDITSCYTRQHVKQDNSSNLELMHRPVHLNIVDKQFASLREEWRSSSRKIDNHGLQCSKKVCSHCYTHGVHTRYTKSQISINCIIFIKCCLLQNNTFPYWFSFNIFWLVDVYSNLLYRYSSWKHTNSL